MRYSSLHYQVAKMQNIVVLCGLSVTNPLPVLENETSEATIQKQPVYSGLGKDLRYSYLMNPNSGENSVWTEFDSPNHPVLHSIL